MISSRTLRGFLISSSHSIITGVQGPNRNDCIRGSVGAIALPREPCSYGNEIYYGDASRLDILRAAQTDKARAFVLAIDDVEASLRTAEIVRRHFPHVPVYARARNRQHALRLLDLGTKVIRRETFLSALDLAGEVLRRLGLPEREVRFAIDTFKAQDEQRLIEDYKHGSDAEKARIRAQTYAEELERIFALDVEAQEKLNRCGVFRIWRLGRMIEHSTHISTNV